MRLTQEALADYRGEARVPTYDRAPVRTGIVHIGVGGFHRSHQAVYVDELLGQGETDWGICGIGLLPADSRMRDVLAAQDGLYTVLMKRPDGRVDARVVGSLREYLFVPDEPEAAIDRLSDPDVRLVTLTVTEGGYNLEPATQEFDEQNPVVRADLAGDGAPRTHFRLLTEALRRRRDRGVPPFTVLSCDNIQGNGAVARRTLLRYAELADPRLAAWIAEQVAFPSSMVDRVTPITTDEDRRTVTDGFGLDDAWPVACEDFTQWVVEDRFTDGRPALERVGAQLVPDVLPYELMKLRLLNAGHQVIGYFAFLSGYEFVHDAMQDPVIHDVVARFQREEAEPTLLPVPGMDLARYRATLLERFANPALRDTVARQCLQTSTTIPNFLLPVVRDQLAAGRPIHVGAATVAAWAVYAEESGDWEIVDRRRELLVARAHDPDPCAFIEDRQLFGDLGDDERFREEFTVWRRRITEDGIGAALRSLRGVR